MDREGDLGTATVEYIDPFRASDRYGVDILLSQVGDLGISGSDVESKWKTAVASIDRVESIADNVRELGVLLKRKPPYQVIDEGSGGLTVPFLFASAPDVTDAEVTVSLTQALEIGGEVSFLVAGNGPTLNAKVSVGVERIMRASSGETLSACFVLPVHWERRAALDNEDHNWVVAELVGGDTTTDIEVRKGTVKNALRRRTERVSTIDSGKKPFETTGSETVEAGLGFSAGFKAIGLDVSFTVSATATISAKLSASLPAGHRYTIAYYGGPPGVTVDVER